LKTKFERSVLSAEELSSSILLHALYPPIEKTNSLSSSSNSNVEIISLVDDDDEEPFRKKNKLKHPAGESIENLRYSGSHAIKRNVVFLASFCVNPSQSSSLPPIPSVDSTTAALRLSVSRLLLAEVDCIKAYGKQSYPYIVKMGQRIDYALSTHSNSNDNSFPIDRASVEKATSVLDHRYKKFTRGLYKLPSDGQLVPMILREAVFDMGIKLTDLNVDGVEEVLSPIRSNDQKKKGVIDVDGDSSVSSWPEDDVEEDDD